MKSYEETAKKVLYMRDNILRKRAERRKRVMTFCTPAAALCLALIIGIGMSGANEQGLPPTIDSTAPSGIQEQVLEFAVEGGEGDKRTPDVYWQDTEKNEPNESDRPISTCEVTQGVTSSKLGIETSPVEDDVKTMDICRGFVYFNRIVGEATAARRAYDKLNYFSEVISAKDAEEYYEINIVKILSSLPEYMEYIPSEHTFIKKTDGQIALDSAHFYFDGAENGNITVSCGKELPPYDCIYMLSHENTSEFTTEDGETVTLLMGYKNHDEESGVCELLFADFKLGGVYYRIECRNFKAFDNILLLLNAVIS